MLRNNVSAQILNKESGFCGIYQRILRRAAENISETNEKNMLSAKGSVVTSEDSFVTPVSSIGDLMALSPRKDLSETTDITSDLLTGVDSDSICDITMQEVPMFDDMYIDASSLDYLVSIADSNRNHNCRDRGKESLFIKFDPLYAKNKLDCIDSAIKQSAVDTFDADVGYETSSATSVNTDISVATPKHTMSAGPVLATCGKDKPTQIVPPVVSSEGPKNIVAQSKSTPALVRSVSAILTPTQVATERLISFSGNTPPTAAPRSPRYNHSFSTQEVDRLQSLRIILQKQDQEVFQLRQENRELRSSVQDMEHKLGRTTEDLEHRVKRLTEERDTLRERENKLLQQINDKILSNKQMSIVMEEYEKTISSLIGEQQQEKVQYQEMFDKLKTERDQALNHLASMEYSFNDLLSKYEKCKTVLLEAKEREKVFELKIAEYEIGMKKYEVLYNNLKQITSENLDKANETLETIKKSHTVEITKLNAAMKKHEITISSLQESLAQKTRDNEELTRICDQLINESCKCTKLYNDNCEIDLLWLFNDPTVLEKFITTSDSDHNEGFSFCKLSMSPAGRVNFHGHLDVRLPKDGRIKKAGYCAMRSKRIRKSFKREATYDWNLYNTLVLKVRGDGRSYLLNISCEGVYDITWNDIYHYVLYTRGGPYWQIAKIPFSKFVLGSKGRLQDKQNRMRLDRITHFGISCGDKINGPFNLEIEYVGLECDPTHEEDFAYETYKTEKLIVGV